MDAETHEVLNQAPAFEDRNLFASDAALADGVAREGGHFADARLHELGERLGSRELLALGHLANRHTPELRTHDRFGNRIDEVAYHPAWHEVMALAVERGIHALPWREPRAGAHVARSAMHAMLSQVESGSCCPITMTFACIPAMRVDPALAAAWEPRITSLVYDPRLVPAAQKQGALVGMAMTEKQGGSDVRANTTRATPTGDGDGVHALSGHKWFCSAPMSDAFLTLAQTGDGLTCFFVPRFRPDGTRNPFHIQRLKDKLGNRSNASSEIEYRGTWAQRLGEPGRGVRTILEMVHHTRLDCVSGSAGLMRQALAQAAHHTAHREAFGRRLAEQPLMQNVLADLTLESEAATALMLRLARAFDEAPGDATARAFARIATAIGKYQVCKRAPAMIVEAMECLGGNGYVEESILPRLYREAPVNAIWEGSGNVMCLDVLRAMVREPDALPALLGELREGATAERRLAAHVARIEDALAHPEDAERNARRTVEALALGLQASLLVRHAPAAVADAFCAARLEERSLGLGTLPPGCDLDALVARGAPLA